MGTVRPETSQTIQTMSKLGAEISLPIISKDKLIGILNLGHKEDKTIYSNEDLELLINAHQSSRDRNRERAPIRKLKTISRHAAPCRSAFVVGLTDGRFSA